MLFRSAPGSFETYEVPGVSPDMSFLEMLDVVNEGLVKKGEEAIAFDSDCREGICGMCSLVVNGIPHGPDRGTTVCQLHMRRFKDGETVTIEPWRAKAFPVVKDLVAAAAAPATTVVLTHIAANLRGRRVDAAVDSLSNLAAAQRERIVAQVRVAIELSAEQRERMARALARLAGRDVRLNIAVDPSVVGGASVRIGDDVIDGTMVTRLTQARRTLVG